MSTTTARIALAALAGGLLIAVANQHQPALPASTQPVEKPFDTSVDAAPATLKATAPTAAGRQTGAGAAHSPPTTALRAPPAWSWGMVKGDWSSLYSAWSSWRKTQGPDTAAAREFVAYISTELPSLDDASAALAPAARVGDWEVLLTAFAKVASTATTADQLGKLDGFMQQTLALCGTGGVAAECSSPAFLSALNALAPSLARSFVVRVVRDADACGMPRDQALKPSIEQVLKANDSTPWCL
ncbi:MAG: hypothetical protein GAK28_04337 [Luteibacter sp.]|uniref:hypothetical protein n=1 Tax=Luteibacter sp. TaxID=1886636 RepID=UPI00137D8A63|nr:hypothetical protein [Luteibacter sp.]KAF1003874.1 MAG: hypothetical protein GAK28_04337 [Luteibacter sp.]